MAPGLYGRAKPAFRGAMSLDQPKAFVKHQTVTRDAFLGGRLTLSQPSHGFRAGLDSVLLGAAVAEGRKTDSGALKERNIAEASEVDQSVSENTSTLIVPIVIGGAFGVLLLGILGWRMLYIRKKT